METTSRRAPRVARTLWLGVGLGLAWGAVGVIGAAVSASADDGSGLVGVVGTAVPAVADTAAPVTSGVGERVGGTTDAVGDVLAPLPPPVSEPVTSTLVAVTPTIAQTTDGVDAAVTTMANAGLDALSGVASSGPVGALTDPVLDVATGLPIVGPVVTATGAATALETTADGVDGVVGTTVGSHSPITHVLPPLLAPSPPGSPVPGSSAPGAGPVAMGTATPTPLGITPPDTSRQITDQNPDPPSRAHPQRSNRPSDEASIDASGPPGPARPSSPPHPGPFGAPSSAPGGSTGAASLGPLAATVELDRAHPSSVGIGPFPADDDLPSTPTYETDTSPD